MIFLTQTTLAGEFNIEAGLVRNPYNRVAIPGDDGTAFDLHRAYRQSYFYHRLSYSQKLSEKHGVRFLYAPLRLTGSFDSEKAIDFQGVTLPAGKISTEYQFNSYRGSWFYQLKDDNAWNVRIGVTAKIRNAKTKLDSGTLSKIKRNTGVVPLLYFFTEYKPGGKFRLAFDFDGWAAPQGRAIDAALMAGYYLHDNLHVNLGYRILEGGVDNDKVYNFSRLEYVFTTLQLNF